NLSYTAGQQKHDEQETVDRRQANGRPSHDNEYWPTFGKLLPFWHHKSDAENQTNGSHNTDERQHKTGDDQALEFLGFLAGNHVSPQICRGERIDGTEIGAAITAAQRDRFDRLAAGWTLFCVAPSGEGRLNRLIRLIDDRSLGAAVRPASADFR